MLVLPVGTGLALNEVVRELRSRVNEKYSPFYFWVNSARNQIKMMNKEMLSHTIPVIQDSKAERPAYGSKSSRKGLLKKVWLWLKGEKKNKTFLPDPASDVIALIANQEVAGIVKDLHYKTPRSLMAMRKSCQECFMLPDDCPYYDYTIFDVKKAIKKLTDQPGQVQIEVVKELQKVNTELAYHLNEYLD